MLERRDPSLSIPGRIYTVGHTCTCTYPCAVNVFPDSKLLPPHLVHHFKLKFPSHTRARALSRCGRSLLLATLVIVLLWQCLKLQVIKRVSLISVGSVGVDLQRQICSIWTWVARQAKTLCNLCSRVYSAMVWSKAKVFFPSSCINQAQLAASKR